MPKNYETSESTYGRHPIFEIREEGVETNIISFGIKKAEAILANIEEIKLFVEKNKKDKK